MYSPPQWNWLPMCMDTGRLYAHDLHTTTASSSSGGTAWPSANLALFLPFYIRVPGIIYTLNGTTGGNIDAGLYNEAGAALFRNGSVAQAGAVQAFTITGGLSVGTGRYWFGVAKDDAVGQLRRWTNATNMTNIQKMFAMAQMTASFPLPATITFAASAQAYIPHIGINFTTQGI